MGVMHDVIDEIMRLKGRHFLPGEMASRMGLEPLQVWSSLKEAEQAGLLTVDRSGVGVRAKATRQLANRRKVRRSSAGLIERVDFDPHDMREPSLGSDEDGLAVRSLWCAVILQAMYDTITQRDLGIIHSQGVKDICDVLGLEHKGIARQAERMMAETCGYKTRGREKYAASNIVRRLKNAAHRRVGT